MQAEEVTDSVEAEDYAQVAAGVAAAAA